MPASAEAILPGCGLGVCMPSSFPARRRDVSHADVCLLHPSGKWGRVNSSLSYHPCKMLHLQYIGRRRRHPQCGVSRAAALPVPAMHELAAADDFSIGMIAGNFLTLGTTLLLPALCVPADQRDEAAKGLSTAAFNLM